jgi:hypothetical protein
MWVSMEELGEYVYEGVIVKGGGESSYLTIIIAIRSSW